MKPLVVMALESESQNRVEATGFDVLYVGVGKVNAAYVLAKHLALNKNIPFVLNLGSAGSPRFKTGETVACADFVQRDMDATGIGFKIGETPFDDAPITLSFKQTFADLPHGVCGSGDSFLQGASPVPCDVIDMEAYALAKVCAKENMHFACVKYITDGADHTAHMDWQENLKHAADAFHLILKSL